MRATDYLLAAVMAAPILGGCSAKQVWFDRTGGPGFEPSLWTGVASDATGTHLVAVDHPSAFSGGSGIWTSTDSGMTWANRTEGGPAAGQTWAGVASDATGTHLVAVGGDQGQSPSAEVWTSADAGATWTKRTTVSSTSSFVEAPIVISDATGTHLVLAAGDVWTSADSGATWTDQTAGTSSAAQSWVGMASDTTATHLVGVTAYSDIWTSSDAGVTWINRTKGTATSGQTWSGVASDATGTHLVAVSNLPGDVWTSADSGATWTNRTAGTAGEAWVAVASDAAGVNLVAATGANSVKDIWVSTDSGATWSDQTAGTPAADQVWVAVASDTTGAHLVAVSINPGSLDPLVGGEIWTN